jgi:hypothetical protein
MRRLILPILGIFLLIPGTPARAVKLDTEDCRTMAIWGHDIVWARDVGADRKKVLAFLESQRAERPYFVVLVKIFDPLWETKASGEEIMTAIFRDCISRRGVYGSDT